MGNNVFIIFDEIMLNKVLKTYPLFEYLVNSSLNSDLNIKLKLNINSKQIITEIRNKRVKSNNRSQQMTFKFEFNSKIFIN